MSEQAPKKANRPSVTTLLIVAMALFVIGLLLAAWPTYSFIRNTAEGTLHPLEVFGSGEAITLIDDAPYSGYLLSVRVDDAGSALPEMDAAITTSDGAAAQTSRTDRWDTRNGRDYRQFLEIEPAPDGRLEILIRSPQQNDILLYRRPGEVLAHEARRAMAEWTVASIPILARVLLRSIVSPSEIGLELG